VRVAHIDQAPSSHRKSEPKNVRFTPPPEGRFCRGWRAKRQSAITDEFSALGACAETDEFLRVTGHLSVDFRRSQKTVAFLDVSLFSDITDTAIHN
jgi:hypothetical protein